jgi:hypothetical protein
MYGSIQSSACVCEHEWHHQQHSMSYFALLSELAIVVHHAASCRTKEGPVSVCAFVDFLAEPQFQNVVLRGDALRTTLCLVETAHQAYCRVSGKKLLISRTGRSLVRANISVRSQYAGSMHQEYQLGESVLQDGANAASLERGSTALREERKRKHPHVADEYNDAEHDEDSQSDEPWHVSDEYARQEVTNSNYTRYDRSRFC